MQDVITAHFRFALDGELPAGRIADIRPGSEPNTVVVIIEPKCATQELLDEMNTQLGSMLATRQWYRLPDSPQNRIHPRRVLHAGWQLKAASAFPTGRLCMSMESPHRHDWLIREGHASFHLVAVMTWLLTRMVRSEIWIQRGTGDDADSYAD